MINPYHREKSRDKKKQAAPEDMGNMQFTPPQLRVSGYLEEQSRQRNGTRKGQKREQDVVLRAPSPDGFSNSASKWVRHVPSPRFQRIFRS